VLIDTRLKHTGPFIIRDGGTISGLIRDEDLFRCLTKLRGKPTARDTHGDPAAF
jgi:hypothetical protein